ncbi:MAG: aminopeptidase P family protein [Rhodospirillales bacterium]|nr:aminopeptidase P family protein [Rhodospirillales bacterium]
MTDTLFLGETRKIDPSRRPSDSSRDGAEIGPTDLVLGEWRALGLALPDMTVLRDYRLGRVRSLLRELDLAGLLLFDPLNIRYATDSMNMQAWTSHNFARACFVPTEGPVILWDFIGCAHLTRHLPLIEEIRFSASFFYFTNAEHADADAERFAAEIDDLLRQYGGGNRRLAVDKMELPGAFALQALGVDLHSGQRVMELARLIKDANELRAIRCAVAATEAAVDEMRKVLVPGISENALWAELHRGNIARGGEWIETRLLASGPRTNPWFHECGPRVIQDGDLLGFDTDCVSTYGYCCDISRTWLTGERKPSDEQRRLYQIAYEHIQRNMELLRPGVSFEELSLKGDNLSDEFAPRRYCVKFHGIGLCDEFPSIRYSQDFVAGVYRDGYDHLQPGMTLTVEAYIGAVGGREGVKLEDQVLITETGIENLTSQPFDADLLAS